MCREAKLMRALEAVTETLGWSPSGSDAASDSNTVQPVNTHSENGSHATAELVSMPIVCVLVLVHLCV